MNLKKFGTALATGVLAVTGLGTMATAPANASGCEYHTITTKHRFHGDTGEDGPSHPSAYTQGRIFYKVCQPDKIHFYRISGYTNFRGTSMNCDASRSQGSRYRFTFNNGDRRTVWLPCDNDTVASNRRRISVTIYNPGVCPVYPCYAAATVKVKHILMWGGGFDQRWTSPNFFIS